MSRSADRESSKKMQWKGREVSATFRVARGTEAFGGWRVFEMKNKNAFQKLTRTENKSIGFVIKNQDGSELILSTVSVVCHN